MNTWQHLLINLSIDQCLRKSKTKVDEENLEVGLTMSSGLCPGQAPASCFGWWREAGVQQKSGHFSFFELLKVIKKQREYFIKVQKNKTFRISKSKVQKFSPVLLSVRGRDIKHTDWCPFFTLGFWISWTLLDSSALYSGAVEHAPRWLRRHRNLSTSSVTLEPLVSFRLSPLNVFDFCHPSDKSCYLRCHNQTPLTFNFRFSNVDPKFNVDRVLNYAYCKKIT